MIARIAERDLAAEARRDGVRRRAPLAPERVVLRSCVSRCQLFARQRLRPDLEALVPSPLFGDSAALDDRVRCPIAAACGDARRRSASPRRLERDLRAALEVDPEVQALDAERDGADHDDRSGDREPEVAAAHEVDLEPLRGLLALRAHEARVVEPAEAGEQAEHRARGGDGRDQRDHGADQEHQREALHLRGRDGEEDERRDRRDDVRVEDRAEALRVAGRDRGAHGLPGAHLFLDAFEDDDVRVGRDADRQDQAGEARQGQRDAEEQDRGVEEGRVDPEADHGDEAEEAVEEEQEERDDEEADDRRALRLRQRVLAERGRDVGALGGRT